MSQIYAYVTTYQVVHFKYVQSLSFIIYTSVSLFLKYPSKTTLSTLPSGTNTLVFSPFNVVLDFFNACITRSKYCFFLRGGMDREAWRAAIHGVSKSRTRLSD